MKKTTFRTTLKAIRKAVISNRELLYSTLQKPAEGFVVDQELRRRLHYAFQALHDVDETLTAAIDSLPAGK